MKDFIKSFIDDCKYKEYVKGDKFRIKLHNDSVPISRFLLIGIVLSLLSLFSYLVMILFEIGLVKTCVFLAIMLALYFICKVIGNYGKPDKPDWA